VTLALLTVLALAAEPVPADVAALTAAIELSTRGDRPGAVRKLDALLKDQPDSVDAHVLRGINRHLLGDAAGAREDLAWAFDAERLTKVSLSSKDFRTVETETTTVDLRDQRIHGAATLALIDARAGDPAAALATVERARGVFGDDGRLHAAEARALLASGKSAPAWSALATARKAPDPTGFTQSIASEMAAVDPGNAPADLVASLEASGQWSAYYNRARGALGKKDYAGCTAAAREGLAAFDEVQLVEVGYLCAARSDASLADTWLVRLGGAGKAAPNDVLAHAATLDKADRRADAVALLQAMPKKLEAAQAKTRQTLLLEDLTLLGRLDDALAIADGATSPASEVRLAHALVAAKRIKDASKVLERACPALKGDPAGPGCEQLLTWVQSQ
jgi:hypothetical protein